MRATHRQRRTLNYVLTAALLLGQMAGFMALPRTAEAALSADPNAEIVYIDDNSFIRVLDTQGDPLVQWVSPDNGWDNITLLDVQNDGDLEILALDVQGESNLRVTLFDPVLARGATDLNKVINGIPWDILWTTSFGGEGRYVVGGNFDPNIPGDELAIGFNNGNTGIVEIYNASSLDPSTQAPTGRDWKRHIRKEYPNIRYDAGFSGQVFNDGADELLLVDSEKGVSRLDIFLTDQDMASLDALKSDEDRYLTAAVGQMEEGGQEEFVTVRSVPRITRESLVTSYVNSSGDIKEVDDAAWAFAPRPDVVFLADIRDNDDMEIFSLREYPDGEEGARLLMRDEWGSDKKQNEDLIEWDLMDGGSKNEFRAGAGGDVDGDGKDEVILLRDDRIRIYRNPENGHESSSNFTDYRLKTDDSRDNLMVGDLDRNGFNTGPILVVSGNMIDAIVPAGTMSDEFTVSVSNVGAQGNVGINAIVPSGNSWVQVNPTFGTTPVTFRVRFNATSINPGNYNTTMTLKAAASNVQNDNYVVYLNLIVIPPVLEPSPPILSMYRLPCENDPCSDQEIADRSAPFTTTVRVDGSDDLAFRAALIDVPSEPTSNVATTSVAGLAGPITGGAIDDSGNIVLYDDLGNSRTLGTEFVTSAATLTTTMLVDPALTWVTSATVDSDIVPADISMVISPTVLTQEFQREYAVLVLVADTRAGTPAGNVKIVPVELANIGGLLWISFLGKE